LTHSSGPQERKEAAPVGRPVDALMDRLSRQWRKWTVGAASSDEVPRPSYQELLGEIRGRGGAGGDEDEDGEEGERANVSEDDADDFGGGGGGGGDD
jgi:hypothetical protein